MPELTVIFIIVPLVVLLVAVGTRLIVVERDGARYRAEYRYTERNVAEARRHSRETSAGTLRGKAAEQLAPFLPSMIERFVPSDCRFLGSPIDYVVFDGLSDGMLKRIVVVEVKAGRQRLDLRQSQIRTAGDAGLIPLEFATLTLPLARKGRPPAVSGVEGFEDRPERHLD